MRDPLPKADDYYMNPVASIFGFRKGLAIKSDEFSEKCQRGEGGGVIFNQKIYLQNINIT